jgi:hypothetical protein
MVVKAPMNFADKKGNEAAYVFNEAISACCIITTEPLLNLSQESRYAGARRMP